MYLGIPQCPTKAVYLDQQRPVSTWIARELHKSGGPCVERFVPPSHHADLRVNRHRGALAFSNDEIVGEMERGDFNNDEVCGEFFRRAAVGSGRVASLTNQVRDAFACSPLNYTKRAPLPMTRTVGVATAGPEGPREWASA